MREEGTTDSHDEVNSLYSQFCETPKNPYSLSSADCEYLFFYFSNFLFSKVLLPYKNTTYIINNVTILFYVLGNMFRL